MSMFLEVIGGLSLLSLGVVLVYRTLTFLDDTLEAISEVKKKVDEQEFNYYKDQLQKLRSEQFKNDVLVQGLTERLSKLEQPKGKKL
jgi:hypothetical protein